MNKKEISISDNLLWRIIISFVLFMSAGLVIDHEPFKSLTYLSAALLLVYNTGKGHKLFSKFFLNERFITVLTAAIAFAIGRHSEAAAIMLFLRVIDYVRFRAYKKSTNVLDTIPVLNSEYADVVRNEEILTKSVNDVYKNDIIVIKSGARVPVDGIVTVGESFIDTRAFTGESTPHQIGPGSEILSGSINSGSPIYARVQKTHNNSCAAKLIKLTQSLQDGTSKIEQHTARFTNLYTPIIAVISLIIMIIPPLFTGFNFKHWIYLGLILAAVCGADVFSDALHLNYITAVNKSVKLGVFIKSFDVIGIFSKIKYSDIEQTKNISISKNAEALSSADISILTKDDSVLLKAHKLAKKAVHSFYGNTIFIIIMRLIIVLMSAFGLSLWLVVFFNFCITIITTANSIR